MLTDTTFGQKKKSLCVKLTVILGKSTTKQPCIL